MPKALDLKAFERRVRIVRFWRGLTIGLLTGSLVACALIAILRLQGHVAPWTYAATLIASVSLIWAVASCLRKIPRFELADSLDRRAGLKNRLATALSLTEHVEGLEADLQSDASRRLEAIHPNRVYPIRFGRLQASAFALVLIAGGIAILGSRPIVLSDAERSKLADASDAASAVERVLQPYTSETPKAVGKLEKSEVAEMEKLARDLREGKLDREEALQKANKAVEEAKQLEAKTAENEKANLEKAETAMQKLDQAASQSTTPIDPATEFAASEEAHTNDLQRQIDDLKKSLDSATGKQAEALKNQIQGLQKQVEGSKQAASEAEASFKAAEAQHLMDERHLEDVLKKESMPGAGGGTDPMAEFKGLRSRLMAATQAEIANIKKRLETATGAEAERLRKKLAELEAQFDKAKKELDAYNKSIQAAIKALKAKKALEEKKGPNRPIVHTKFNKPMRAAMDKLKQALNKIESGDDLSKEESNELKKIGDEMDVESANAAAAGDQPRQLTASVLADAARALAQGNAAIMVAGACRSALGGLGGVPPPITQRGGGAGDDVHTPDEHNTGKVNHLDKAAAGRGTTTPTMVDPLMGDGPSSYIEVRGPASLGARSAIPYRSVLPSYQRKEEAALSGGKIPRKHLKRVRAYFDSLTGN